MPGFALRFKMRIKEVVRAIQSRKLKPPMFSPLPIITRALLLGAEEGIVIMLQVEKLRHKTWTQLPKVKQLCFHRH